MKLLVVGSGGREHALSWKLAQSPKVEKVFVAPGNPGMALESNLQLVPLAIHQQRELADFCKKEGVEFVVVGPDQALADGLVNFFESQGIAAFGPTKEAAQIEASKAFSKDLMKSLGIPTAKYLNCVSVQEAHQFLDSQPWGDGWVIKADGLALGKGVVVCESKDEAKKVCADFLGGAFGASSAKIVIEERLLGREVSAFHLCDGQNGVPLAMACDHKRIFDGDRGPNTGGMGAFTPADWVNADLGQKIQSEVVNPLLKGMAAKGIPFKGVLFTGLMITKTGPKVLEFNARFGDPETQAILPLLSDDLLPWLEACQKGTLHKMSASGPQLKAGSSVHVVWAAEGYPGDVKKGDRIEIPGDALPGAAWEKAGVKVFFAGVSGAGNALNTNGGRVLGVTAWGKNRNEARARAYDSSISFRGMQRRSDVGAQ